MTDPTDPPTIAEIAALTGRLRDLSDAGRTADPAEVARFLANKHDLIERITARSTQADAEGIVGSDAADADEPPFIHEHRAILNHARPRTDTASADAVEQARRAVAQLPDTDTPQDRVGRRDCTTYAHLFDDDTTDVETASPAGDADELDRQFDELIERYPLPDYEPGADGRGWWVDAEPIDDDIDDDGIGDDSDEAGWP